MPTEGKTHQTIKRGLGEPEFHYALELVRSHDDYSWNEAVTVWIIQDIALFLSIGMSAAIVLAAMRDHHDD